jgi:hypothetical protein
MPSNGADPVDTDDLVSIFQAYELVPTSTRVRASWVKVGFQYCKRDVAFYFLVNDGKIRDSPEFSEIRCIISLIEKLSARRRAQQCRFINRQFFKGRYLKILEEQGFD